MSNIERAFKVWVDTLNDVFATIFQSCNEWNPDVWQMIKDINAGLTVVAAAMVPLFFLFGLIKSGMRLQDLRHPEAFFEPFIRLALSVAFLNAAMTIMVYVFQIMQGVMGRIAGYGSVSFSMSVPEEIAEALDDTSILSFDGIMVGIVGLLLLLAVYIMAIILLVLVWGRFLNMYIHCAIAPCFFSCLSAEPTQHFTASFVKSYINVLFQGVVIVLALMIYSRLISSDHTAAVAAVNDGDNFGGIMLYAKDFLVGGLVALVTCKVGEQLAGKMGLQ
ncbi:type IV secretion system protein [Ihubacter sp. mB4P-1]|uniref:type IV secretion system protein n=1 Tax=Ihubacter sp. mB4P-1 TaxID=3242370 RepID=UPI003C7D3FBE